MKHIILILILILMSYTTSATEIVTDTNLIPYHNYTGGKKGLLNGNYSFSTSFADADIYSSNELTSGNMNNLSLADGINISQVGTNLREPFITVDFHKKWITGIDSFDISAIVETLGGGTTQLGIYNYNTGLFEAINTSSIIGSYVTLAGTATGSSYWQLDGDYVDFRVAVWTNGYLASDIGVDLISADFQARSLIPEITFISPTLANDSSTDLGYVFVNVSSNVGGITGNLSWKDNLGTVTNYSITMLGDMNYFRVVYAFRQPTENTYQVFTKDQFGNNGIPSAIRTITIPFNYSIVSDGGDAWVENGVTWAEDYYPIRTWTNLTELVPVLAGMNVNIIEMLSIWEPASPDKPTFRWSTQSYTIDTTRGTEAEFNTFVDTAHSYGIKVVPIMLFITTFSPDNRCVGRTGHRHAKNGSIIYQIARWDSEGIGGALYQYQIAHPEKQLLLNNTANDYSCVWSGNGLLTDTDSQDTIDYFANIYQTQILNRNLDGVRFDVPIFRNCMQNETFFIGKWPVTCFDPVVGKHSPWPLMRKIYSMKKPGDIILSETWDTGIMFRNTSAYPGFYLDDPDIGDEWLEESDMDSLYDPYTDVEEVATVPEGYEYIRELYLNIYNNASFNSTDYRNWIINQPIAYNRSVFRMIRNWNGFSGIFSKIVGSMYTYYPSVTLAVTSPGVPKTTDYELFGSPEKEAFLISRGKLPPNWVLLNSVSSRMEHWNKLLNIRKDHTSLNARNYNMSNAIIGSETQVIAYNRWNGTDNVTVVANFAKTTKNIKLNTLLGVGKVTALDLLTNNVYCGQGQSFNVSIKTNTSIVLYSSPTGVCHTYATKIGSNSNDCLSWAAPCYNISTAQNRTVNSTVHFGFGNYSGQTLIRNRAMRYKCDRDGYQEDVNKLYCDMPRFI